MTTRRWAALLALLGAAACGGTVTVTGAAGSGTGSTSGAGTGGASTTSASTTGATSTSTTSASTSSGVGGQGPCNTNTPMNHRPQAPACPPSTPTMPCMTDADCTKSDGFGGLLMGTCVTSAAGQACDYNVCSTDATCPDPTNACVCQGQHGGQVDFGSVCVPANCHTDADCGPNGFCSPSGSVSCGSHFGTVGFYCHTCADVCVDDTDCQTGTPPTPSSCVFDPTVSHWTCTSGVCLG